MPIRPMKKNEPHEVRSFFVTRPKTAIAPNIPAAVRNAWTIDACEYAQKITLSVRPFRNE